MKTTVTAYDFERDFVDAGRQDQFSYEGRAVLFDYLEEYEASTGQELELDVVALCCDYYESSTEEIILSYRIDVERNEDVIAAVDLSIRAINKCVTVGESK